MHANILKREYNNFCSTGMRSKPSLSLNGDEVELPVCGGVHCGEKMF